jgi:hypothetical protein
MRNLYENNIVRYRGMQENDNPLVIKGDGGITVLARVCENVRPVGGLIRKVLGNTRSWSGANETSITYKAVSRATTLIRWTNDAGTRFFMALAWDNMFVWSGSAWNAMMLKRRDETGHQAGDHQCLPGNLLFGAYRVGTATENEYTSFVNHIFDWFIYNDILYLTDGANRPIKTDGTSVGAWGLKQYTGTQMLLGVQGQAGTIANDTYQYKMCLYDDVRGSIGELEENAVSVVIILNRKIWVYVNCGEANNVMMRQGNHDYEDGLALKWRVYRNPGVSGGSAFYYLAGEMPAGLITSGLVTAAIGAAGNLEDTLATFTTDGTSVNDCVWYENDAGVWGARRISAIVDDNNLTLLDPDGTAHTPNLASIGQSYRVVGGLLDDTNDLTGEAIHFSDDATLTAEEADHSPPPRGKFCVNYKDRGFMVDPDDPNKLRYSQVGLMDYFPLDNNIEINPESDDGDVITALVVFKGKLLIFKKHSTSLLTALGSPFEWIVTPKFFSVGAERRRAIADCDSHLIFANLNGIYSYNGSSVNKISHKENNSNIIQKWKDVQLDELYQAQAEFNEARNEFWISITMDDERGLYDASQTGLGSVYEGSPGAQNLVASDSPAPCQNNATFVYRLETGDWFYMPNVRASAWTVFKGQGDFNELYRAWYQAAILREDFGETTDEQTGESGQATSGTADTLTDTNANGGNGWTVDEWDGATLYKMAYSDGVIESEEILSNTATELTVASDWTINPVLSDYYIILFPDDSNPMSLRWKTQKMVFRSFRDVKWLVELLARIEIDGTATIEWTVSGGKSGDVSGQFQLTSTQAATLWGEDNWGTVDDGSTLIYTVTGEIVQSELPFPNTAEGLFVEFEITLSTSKKFELTLLSLGYKLNSGSRWLPA